MDCKNLTIYCKEGSAAHTYADNNNIRYRFDNSPAGNDTTKKYTVTYNANGAISGAGKKTATVTSKVAKIIVK